MKKEFYKLIFVFIMIVFSFSLAFFLGREITLQQKQSKTKPPKNNLSTSAPFPTQLAPKAEHTQREKVKMYKKTLDNPSTESDPYVKINKQEPEKPSELHRPDHRQELKLTKPAETEPESTLESTSESTEKKASSVVYVLFISSYNNQDSAIAEIDRVKSVVSSKAIFFKQLKNSQWGVYIGPFKAKESAENFLKKLRKKPGFSTVKLEKL